MADEPVDPVDPKDPTSPKDPVDPVDPKGPKNPDPSPGDDGNKDEPGKGKEKEPLVPLSRVRELSKQIKELETELAGKSNVPEDEQKLREVIKKMKKEEADSTAQQEKEWSKKMNDLRKVHGDFNEENLAEIIEQYGLFNSDGSIKFEKAMDLYNRLGGNPNQPPPKKKIPSGGRGGDGPKDGPVDVKGKTMYDLLHDAKQELGS